MSPRPYAGSAHEPGPAAITGHTSAPLDRLLLARAVAELVALADAAGLLPAGARPTGLTFDTPTGGVLSVPLDNSSLAPLTSLNLTLAWSMPTRQGPIGAHTAATEPGAEHAATATPVPTPGTTRGTWMPVGTPPEYAP